MDNQDFWSVYPQDNHCYRDLNHQKRSLIFRIWIKCESKCKSRLKKPQKRSPKWTRTQTQDRHPRGPLGTLRVPNGTNYEHSPRAPRLRNLIIFSFLEIRMRPSLYFDHLANFLNIPTSINRGGLLKFSILFSRFLTPPPPPPSYWLSPLLFFSLLH